MLTDIPFNIVYASGENEPVEFFFEALLESKSFDLGLGFFNSSGINVLHAGFAYFILNGGSMRIIINDVLSQDDKQAIEFGIDKPDSYFENIIINNFNILSETLSKHDKYFFRCLSYLISKKRIEFIATVPNNNKGGIAHNKFGIFTDKNNNKVAFNGSINFSKTALLNNIESISCYKSWSGESNETERLAYFENIFNKTWDGKAENIRIIPIKRVKCIIEEWYPVENIHDLIDEEEKINSYNPKYSKKIIEFLKTNNQIIEKKPCFPFPEGPREYQKEAYNAWVKKDHRGTFAMATGTGKTLTALYCVLEEYKQNSSYQVLILVPTLVLLFQWIKEASRFNFLNISSSANLDWKEHFSTQLFLSANNVNSNFIFITTYATFNGKKFQNLLRNKKLDNIILICDEVHNLGSKASLKNLPNNITKRIGLSATPNRKYDERGSIQIENFFNAYPPCYTFSFSMKRAIDQNFLTKYEYHPYLASLTPEELNQYKELSKQLLKHYDFKQNKYKDSADFLLIKRKRIIHQAENKKEIFLNILKEIKSKEGKNLKHILVYVPEGYDHNYSISDDYKIDNDDQRIINEYSRIITENQISTYQLLGETKNRAEILEKFENGKIAVLTAMKTLDEGVDVPATKYAIFCASTGNPRQFIQRRGRILRKFPQKKLAYVYDIIIAPNLIAWDNEPYEIRKKLLSMEINIFRSEIYRVANFLYACENRPEISLGRDKNLLKLVELANRFEINLDGMINELVNADEAC
jgi:superfamily II DNA or RNA helicase